MPVFNPYLNFNGNTEEAFNFYKKVFGGDFDGVMRYSDLPDRDNIPESVRDKIMHIALPIGNGNMLMGTDAMEAMGLKLVVGNNFYITISVDSKEEADRLFAELSEGGKIESPMQDMFWGAYFGMLADRFGTQWMISYDTRRQP